MKQREQYELSDEARRELDALDRALAGEPVDAEFDEVARLAREMRAVRPEPSEEFAEQLDERAASGFPPEHGSPSPFAIRVREWLAGARPMRLLAPAGAVATIAIVASVAVIQTGGGEDAAQPTETAATTPATEEGGAGTAAAPATAESDELSQAGSGAPPAEDFSFEVPPSGNALDRERVAPGSEREVERSATLTLSAEDEEFEDVADGVVEVTDQFDGFVLSSEESSSGETSRAVFDLEIPSEDLSAALADLSALAHVEARSEDAVDITAQSVTARQRLTDARAQVDGLLGQLATADTAKESDRIASRLELARAEVARAKAEFQKLARRVNFSNVRVTVTSDGGGDGDWGVDEAIDDIGDALSTAGGVALISAAIILPIGLVIALLALAWRRTVRRGRERALGE
jgi:hypothetical protein